MRYVYFKRLRIINFLSVGKKPVEINFKPGLNIITGQNYDKADRANGVGKTTIADAVHFALYGTPIRELKKENIVNDQHPESLCEVELDFSFQEGGINKECKIVRTINPTKCVFIVDGKDETRSSIIQTTELITGIIKTSPEVFQNSVVMTINNTVPFMAQKKVEKRKFIEGILGLEVFGNMLLQARSDFNDVRKNIEVESAKLQETIRSLAEATRQRDVFVENQSKQRVTLDQRKKSLETDLEDIVNKINSFEPVNEEAEKKLLSKQKEIADIKEDITKKLSVIRNNINDAKRAITFYTDKLKKLKKIDNKCPKCSYDLAEAANMQYELDKSSYEKEINTNKETLKINTEQEPQTSETYNKIIEADVKILNKIKEFQVRKTEYNNLLLRKKQFEIWQQQLLLDIENLNKESSNFQENIDKITLRQFELKTTITDLQETLDIIENAKFITSEEGVKSFIVKRILQVLNTRLAVYLKRLESNSIVVFNEFFEETITNERGTSCSYFNFSGAERKAIDLAMLFTFQDIRRAQADVWLNLSMFDELFDCSLDEKGIELVIDILKERVENYSESVYIISHRKESKKYCTGGEVVFLVKKNGITTRLLDHYDISK